MKNILSNSALCKLLEKMDADLTAKIQEQGCVYCGGVLHRGDYQRKPRGGPAWDRRYSLCCSRQGCRRRMTPPSVRFLGRKVYVGFVVVLISAMMCGLQKKRVKRLQDELGIDRRTLSHWRIWWQEFFVHCAFWQAKRSFFRLPVSKETMPLGLVEAFSAQYRHGMLKLLHFLAPITTRTCPEMLAI